MFTGFVNLFISFYSQINIFAEFIIADSQPLRGHEKEQSEVFFFILKYKPVLKGPPSSKTHCGRLFLYSSACND